MSSAAAVEQQPDQSVSLSDLVQNLTADNRERELQVPLSFTFKTAEYMTKAEVVNRGGGGLLRTTTEVCHIPYNVQDTFRREQMLRLTLTMSEGNNRYIAQTGGNLGLIHEHPVTTPLTVGALIIAVTEATISARRYFEYAENL